MTLAGGQPPPDTAEVRSFVATCPINTPIAVPVVVPLPMPPRSVTKIRVRIPPGPNGSMGFALGSSGGTLIPAGAGNWIVGDNETYEFTQDGGITSGAWEVHMYNLGLFPHSIYITFDVELPTVGGQIGPGQPLSATDLTAPPVAADVETTSALPAPPELT